MANSFVFTLKDSKKWSNLLEECEERDIHFDPKYLSLFEEKINGKALLFVTKEKENFLLYPFFKRKINDESYFNELDEELYDIISPWYFGGLILQNSKNSKKLINKFLKEFKEYTIKEKIVSEFTRIHPLLKQSQNFIEQVNSEYRYDVSYVNLNQNEEDIIKNMKKTNKNACTSAEKHGVKIEFSNSEKAINEFFVIYTKFINQIETSDFYNFSLEFLQKIRTSFANNIIIVLARYKEKIIAGSIFLFKGGIVHYWLSATDYEYRKLSPTNLLLLKSTLFFKEKGQKTFFLMGGTDEKLRKFKESFSNTTIKFYTYSEIHNNEKYLKLVKYRHKNKDCKNSGFFPAYRE